MPPTLELGGVREARERGLLAGGGDVERATHLPDGGDDVVGADAVADPEPGEPVDLRERAQDEHPVAGLEVLLDRVGVVGLVDVLEVGLVDDGEDVLIKRKSGQPDFLVELASTNVDGTEIEVERE